MDDMRKPDDVDPAIWADPTEIDQSERGSESGAGFRERAREFLQVYRQKRKIALTIIGAGIVISIAYSLSLKNEYTSTTTLMPQNNSSPYSSMLSLVTGSSSAAALGSEALGIGTPSDLQISILESRLVQDAMIARFNLMNRYKAKVIEDARKTLSDHTKISQDRVSGIITIAVTDTNPDFACQMAKEYVAQLNRVLTQNSTSAAKRERLFF
jgi:tyrosine-protein kinase Etk/Wzc